VLNTLECVQDLIEKHYTIYSDRPRFTMVGEIMGLDAVRILPQAVSLVPAKNCAEYATKVLRRDIQTDEKAHSFCARTSRDQAVRAYTTGTRRSISKVVTRATRGLHTAVTTVRIVSMLACHWL
jgi:hypothetical protein